MMNKTIQTTLSFFLLLSAVRLLVSPPQTCRAQEHLTVDRAVQIAIENSLQRRMVAKDVEIADEGLARARAEFGPTVTLQGGLYRYNATPTIVQTNQGLAKLNNALSAITYGQVPEVSLPSDSRTYYGAGLNVTQPLYTGNKLTATRRLAQANLEHARKNLDASDNDLALSARKAFYTVIFSRQMARAMDEAVQSMTEHVKEATAYHNQKIVPKLDLLRAEEKLADLRQQQLYTHNNEDLAQTALNYVLGVDMDTRYTYDDPSQTLPMPQDLGTCIQTGLEDRPEISAMDSQIQMAKQQIAIAQSDYLPTLALVGEAHRYEPENEDPSAQIGIVASIELFDSGRTSHKKAQAGRQLEKALTAKKQLSRGIRLEVEKAYHDAQAALKSIDVAQKSLETAKEALDAARTRYRVGVSTSLERLDAEVSLTRAKTNHIHALNMYNIAVAELERAMGKE
ncbi:TolC family protein [uncultured Desulfobacter sp.]|uniref:TolC family protein n=1 Tax=uncultured Desulfobacter sp. TaxID=240139 RepID=UPI0029F4A2EA|nr:TolC family protein [uncultured Desulfobacter sp.]